MIGLIAALCGLLWLGVSAQASAQDVGTVSAGRALAEQWCAECAECHDVSREPIPRIAGAPPSFVAVANDPAVTEIWLQPFFVTPHPVMPNIILTAEQADDMVAYVLSLKGG